MAAAAEKRPPMRLLEIALDRGMITDAQMEMIRAEHTQAAAQGRSKTPTRIAIERGILSDQDAHDLETEAWIRDLPSDLEDYRLVRLVGRGGMAVVFEAQDVSLGKTVAIKLLLPEFSSSDSYLARFHREARIAARFTHPNTVQVFRAGEKEAIQFLVMEFVEGEPISAILRRRGRIPEREAFDVALQVSGALEEAASSRHHPPRRQAGEHPHVEVGRPEAGGFRHRQGVHRHPRRAHPAIAHDGRRRHADVHVARAGARRAGH